jgi:hypothetical protein
VQRNSTLFRKELREAGLHSLLGGSSSTASSNSEPDTLLQSFIFNPVVGDEAVSEQSNSSIEAAIVNDSSKDDFVERYVCGYYCWIKISFALEMDAKL